MTAKHSLGWIGMERVGYSNVLGSTLRKYKSGALVNLDWTTTFAPALPHKDLDPGLKAARDLGVAMPVTARDARGAAGPFRRRGAAKGSGRLSGKGFAALLQTIVFAAGIALSPGNVLMPTGLEDAA